MDEEAAGRPLWERPPQGIPGFLRQWGLLYQGAPLPLSGSRRVEKDVNWGMELEPRNGLCILPFLFNKVIQPLAVLSGRQEPGKFVGALQAWGSISVIAVDLGG